MNVAFLLKYLFSAFRRQLFAKILPTLKLFWGRVGDVRSTYPSDLIEFWLENVYITDFLPFPYIQHMKKKLI